MALVAVEDVGLGMAGQAAEDAQGPDPADAEERLLGQPVIRVAAVEPVGDVAGLLVVALDVRVHEEQRHAADLGRPQLGADGPVAHRDLDAGLLLAVHEGADRQFVRIEDRVVLLLPARGVEALPEVALRVEQADADDRHAEVGGRLEVVAGEDAETAGVLGQHGGDAELGGEVSDGGGSALRLGGEALEPAVAVHVVVQIALDELEVAQIAAVARERVEPLARDGCQQLQRGVAGGLPQLGVEGLEELLGLRVPRPTQVQRQVVQRLEGLGQDRLDNESSDSSHPPRLSGARPGGAGPPIRPACGSRGGPDRVSARRRLGRAGRTVA